MDEGSGKDGSGSSSSSSGGGGGGMDAEEMVVLPRVVQGAGGEWSRRLDNTFEPAVLRSSKALDESTVFFDIKGDYLGAYLGDGRIGPPPSGGCYSIGPPRSVGLHRLTQIWAYKYDSQEARHQNARGPGRVFGELLADPNDARSCPPVEEGNARCPLGGL